MTSLLIGKQRKLIRNNTGAHQVVPLRGLDRFSATAGRWRQCWEKHLVKILLLGERCPPCPVIHLHLPLHEHDQLEDGDKCNYSSTFCFHSITYNRRKTTLLHSLDLQHNIHQATKCKDAPSIIRAQLSPKGNSIDGGDRQTSKQVQRCTYSHNAQLSPIGFRRSPPSIELPKLYRWWGSFVALCGDWRPPLCATCHDMRCSPLTHRK